MSRLLLVEFSLARSSEQYGVGIKGKIIATGGRVVGVCFHTSFLPR
jgi:hypothetical protein